MKKILLLGAMLLMGAASVQATVFVTKSHAAWWGYKYVTETYDNSNYMLTCNGYGWLKCRFHTLSPPETTQPGYENLSDSTLEAIDRTVMGSISESNTSGTIMYGEQFYITYGYNVESDNLTYTIYSIQEATEKGLIH